MRMSAAEGEEGPVDVLPTLVADREPAEVAEPGQRAFDHPAVAAQARAGVDALAGDPDLDGRPLR